MSLGIILPPGVERRPCWHCEVCGGDFAPEQKMAFRLHVIKCAEANEDQVHAYVEQEKSNAFGGTVPEDVKEEFDWLRKGRKL